LTAIGTREYGLCNYNCRCNTHLSLSGRSAQLGTLIESDAVLRGQGPRSASNAQRVRARCGCCIGCRRCHSPSERVLMGVRGRGGNAECFKFIAVYPAFASISHISRSSSVGTLRPHPTFRLFLLLSLRNVSPFHRQHLHTPLGLLVHPPVQLCFTVFGIIVLPSYWDSTCVGCIGKVTSLMVLRRAPCEDVESGDEFRYVSSLPIRPCARYSLSATCTTQQVLHASDTHRAVINVIHPALAIRCATKRGRVGVAS
jgi:hypothetical protein